LRILLVVYKGLFYNRKELTFLFFGYFTKIYINKEFSMHNKVINGTFCPLKPKISKFCNSQSVSMGGYIGTFQMSAGRQITNGAFLSKN